MVYFFKNPFHRHSKLSKEILRRDPSTLTALYGPNIPSRRSPFQLKTSVTLVITERLLEDHMWLMIM